MRPWIKAWIRSRMLRKMQWRGKGPQANLVNPEKPGQIRSQRRPPPKQQTSLPANRKAFVFTRNLILFPASVYYFTRIFRLTIRVTFRPVGIQMVQRSEEHTSELQSL